MALATNRDLVAADEDFTDIVFHDERTLRGSVATALLQAYLPADLDRIEQERFAEFRLKFAAQRLRYDKEIQSIVREFTEVSSEGQLGILKKRIIELAKQRVEDTKAQYKLANLKTVVKALGLSVTPPALAHSIASAIGVGIFEPAGIAAGLSLFAAELLLARDEARLTKARSPWSYVLDAAKLA
jgi:hypothetical protein